MSHEQVPKLIRRLMPSATPSEQQQAAENFREYMRVLLRIYERIVRDSGADSLESEIRDRVDDIHEV